MKSRTVYTSPSDRPKFDFLQTHNFLGEFKSEVDKARVRFNLGIPDAQSFVWGNIRGNIENQIDLYRLLSQIKLNNSQKIEEIEDNISTINQNLLSFNSTLTSNKSELNDKIADILNDISEIKTDVAQNATAIRYLNTSGSGGSLPEPSYDDTYVRSQISDLNTKYATLLTTVSTLDTLINNLDKKQDRLETKYDSLNSSIDSRLSVLTSNIAAYDTKIASHETKLGIFATDINNLKNSLTQLDDLNNIKNTANLNKANIELIKTQVGQLENKSTNFETNLGQSNNSLQNLEQSINSYLNKISILENKVSALEAQLGQINIVSIRSNYEGSTLTGTTTSDPYVISIYAKYSNNSTTEITALCTASSSNNTVATYSNGKITLHSAGTATITFNYQTYSCQIQIFVESADNDVIQYIGYANNWTDLFGKTQGYRTLKGTWTQTNTPDLHTDLIFGLWIITTEDLTRITEMGDYNLSDISQGTHTDDKGNEYKIYMIGPTSSPNLTITIN